MRYEWAAGSTNSMAVTSSGTVSIEVLDASGAAVSLPQLDHTSDVWSLSVPSDAAKVADIGKQYTGAFTITDDSPQVLRQPFTIDVCERVPYVPLTVGENTYLALSDAEAYIDTMPHDPAWDDAPQSARKRALIAATNAVDSLILVGMPSVPTQALAFPRVLPYRPDSALYTQNVMTLSRSGYIPSAIIESSVPNDVLFAVALEAASRVDVSERETMQAQGVASLSLGKMSETYNGRHAKLRNPDALRLLRPFIAGSVAIR